MTLLDPLRRKRDKLCKELLEECTSEKERSAIRALMVGEHLAFYDRFHSYMKCPECHQAIPGKREGWISEAHESFYQVCRRLQELEAQELKERIGAP